MTRNSSTETRTKQGIYPPREDSFLLLPFASVAPGTSVLEIGAGAGVASRAAARSGARVVATDLNLEALRWLRSAARAESLDVQIVRTDLADGLGRFDRVLANPPYLPTRPEERDPDRWTNLALDGGPDGCRVLGRLLARLPDHLAPGGSAYVVGSSLQIGPALAAVEADWRRRGGEQEVVAERVLEGERLVVWRFGVKGCTPGFPPKGVAPRTRARHRETGGRPRTLRGSRSASSRAPGRGRTRVRDGASVRRRSPRGS
jgi:release factor glutamine methyltransferase